MRLLVEGYRVMSKAAALEVRRFIVIPALIEGKGLQALVQILYQILDKTRNVVL